MDNNKTNAKQINEDELENITGARVEETIKPKDSDFWNSFNPSANIDEHELIYNDIKNKK